MTLRHDLYGPKLCPRAHAILYCRLPLPSQNISAHKALASRAVEGGAVKAICEVGYLGAGTAYALGTTADSTNLLAMMTDTRAHVYGLQGPVLSPKPNRKTHHTHSPRRLPAASPPPRCVQWLGACAVNGDVEGAVLCCATLCLLGDGDQAALADVVRYDGIDLLVDMLHPR